MKTTPRYQVCQHSDNSQVRARCSADPYGGVEQRPSQRNPIRSPSVNYEQHRREIAHQENRSRYIPQVKIDTRPLLKVIPACPNFDFMFGTRILIRGSPEYF